MLCAGTHNIIINFNRHFEPVELKTIMDFLDFACGLFDSTMGDWNKIVNTLKMLRERFHLLDDETWKALHMWLPQHKHCGAFLRLMFNADIATTFKPAQDAFIEPDYLTVPVSPVEPPSVVVPAPEKKPRKRIPKAEKKTLAPGLKAKKP